MHELRRASHRGAFDATEGGSAGADEVREEFEVGGDDDADSSLEESISSSDGRVNDAWCLPPTPSAEGVEESLNGGSTGRWK